MANKKLSIIYTLGLFILTGVTEKASAQWYINGSTDLQTDIMGTSGTLGPYHNVVIDNYLAINLSAAPTCPASTYGGGTGSYPLVVNLEHGAMVLWDNSGLDGRRKIIGLSQKGGIAMVSGDDSTNSSGMLLSAPDPDVANLLPGSVVTFSNGNTFTPPGGGTPLLSYGHFNYSPPGISHVPSGSFDPFFTILKDGNSRIGNGFPYDSYKLTIDGDVFLFTNSGKDIYRNVHARSLEAGLHISAGAITDGSDGACLTAMARNNTMYFTPGIETSGGIPTPGAFIVKSNAMDYLPGDGNRIPLGYAYQNYSPSSGIHNYFLIRKDGRGIFGPDIQMSNMVNNDVFTVKSSLGMYDDSDKSRRTIDGNTKTGLLSINSAQNSTNGTTIELYGVNHLATAAYQGQIHYVSSFHPGADGHLFQNWTGTAWKSLMAIRNSADLQTGNDIIMDITGDGSRNIFGHSHTGYLALVSGFQGGPMADGAFMQLCSNNDPSHGSVIIAATGPATSKTDFLAINGGVIHNTMSIHNDGKVVIAGPGHNAGDFNLATANPYGLYVGVGILTEHVKVAIASTSYWADYVFNKNYKLKSLNDVEQYINANKHLPDVPSATDVVNDGVDLGSMDAKLLQKIEELTLYVIQQQKEINILKEQVNGKK